MDAGSTWLHRKLEAWLCEARQEHSDYLVRGSAQDFANYRERVGYIRALDHVLAITDEIAKEGSDAERKPSREKPAYEKPANILYDP